MATRSLIGKQSADGTIRAIYCHWDGYPSGVGATLLEAYTDGDKLDQLLDLGDISSLGSEIGEQHDFDQRRSFPESWTTAYKRDRGESDVDARLHATVADFLQSAWQGYGCDYAYLWTVEGWRYAGYRNSDLRPLTEQQIEAGE